MKTKSITIPVRDIESVVIYADGACPNNGKPNARMYCSFAVYVNEKLVRTQKVDLSDLEVKQTNNTAEFHALIEALSYMTQAQRKGLEFVVRTDSELVYEAWMRKKTVKTRHLRPLYQKMLDLAAELNVKLEQVSGDSMKLVLGH